MTRKKQSRNILCTECKSKCGRVDTVIFNCIAVTHDFTVFKPGKGAQRQLLNIAGINTSFVLYPDNGQVILSARSMNDTNVQVIVEALGGGGNGSAAGAQIPGMTVEEAYRLLLASIDQYFDEDDESDGKSI